MNAGGKTFVWKTRCALFAAILSLVPPALLEASMQNGIADLDDSEIVSGHHPRWFKQSFLDLDSDLDESIDAGKRGLMVYFYTEGCGYCARFVSETLGDPDIRDTLQAHFDVVAIDMFQDDEVTGLGRGPMPAKERAKLEGAFASPTLVVYEAGGDQVFRTTGYHPPARFRMMLDFLIGDHHREKSFRAYAAQFESQSGPETELESSENSLFMSPPFDLVRHEPAPKPLLVLYERKACADCRLFHEHVLDYAPVRILLDDFDLVRLDVDDSETLVITPGGRRDDSRRLVGNPRRFCSSCIAVLRQRRS